jgi:hypothetical protein
MAAGMFHGQLALQVTTELAEQLRYLVCRVAAFQLLVEAKVVTITQLAPVHLAAVAVGQILRKAQAQHRILY